MYLYVPLHSPYFSIFKIKFRPHTSPAKSLHAANFDICWPFLWFDEKLIWQSVRKFQPKLHLFSFKKCSQAKRIITIIPDFPSWLVPFKVYPTSILTDIMANSSRAQKMVGDSWQAGKSSTGHLPLSCPCSLSSSWLVKIWKVYFFIYTKIPLHFLFSSSEIYWLYLFSFSFPHESRLILLFQNTERKWIWDVYLDYDNLNSPVPPSRIYS